MSKIKRIACIACLCFILAGVLAIPVFAVEPETPSGDDEFLCALPPDGQFWLLCIDVDPNYQRGFDYSWCIGQRLFTFNYTTPYCNLISFTPSSGSISANIVDLNNGGSDPPDLASISITKAVVEESSDGYLYDRLYLNFAVNDSSGDNVFPTKVSNIDVNSPCFVSCLEARGMVTLTSNDILKKIASYLPQTSPTITGYIRGATYANGYNTGYNDGQRIGYQTGKDDTYQPAYDSGYNAGYQKALIDSDTFTFRGFLDAVIFAPIDACLQIFDFDFLGFNMRGFVAAVLTLVIIGGVVLVILKFKGGGS